MASIGKQIWNMILCYDGWLIFFYEIFDLEYTDANKSCNKICIEAVLRKQNLVRDRNTVKKIKREHSAKINEKKGSGFGLLFVKKNREKRKYRTVLNQDIITVWSNFS